MYLKILEELKETWPARMGEVTCSIWWVRVSPLRENRHVFSCFVLRRDTEIQSGSPAYIIDECVWKLIRCPNNNPPKWSRQQSFDLWVLCWLRFHLLTGQRCINAQPHSHRVFLVRGRSWSESLVLVVGIMQLQRNSAVFVLPRSTGVNSQPDIPTFLNVRAMMSYFLFPEAWPAVRWPIKPNTDPQSCATSHPSRALTPGDKRTS